MNKVEYPASFNGLVGVSCKETIKHREAFMFIPYKMLLSVGKAKNHRVIGKIIRDNPQMFGIEARDWEQMTLTLFLFYEISRGKESYWYPYLMQMPVVQFTCLWTKDEIEAC